MQNRLVFLIAMLTVSGLALAACNPGIRFSTEVQATATVEAAEEKIEDLQAAQASLSLAGSAWEVDYFFPPEESKPVIEGSRLTTNFFVDRYAGFSGCNWYLGGYTSDETVLRMNTPATTLLPCSQEALAEQEATFRSAMLNTVEYELDGEQLVAYTTDKQRLLTYKPAAPVPFEGTTWSLMFQWDGEDYQPVVPQTEVTAVFEGERLVGSAGCNDYGTTFERREATFNMSADSIEATAQACETPEGIMDQEALYLETLGTVAGYAQAGGMLVLSDAENTPVLIFGAK